MDPSLEQLARALGVATEYEDWARRPIPVAEATVRRVLEGLGIDASHPASALAAQVAAEWERVLPPAVVIRRSTPRAVRLHCPVGSAVRAEIHIGSGDEELVTTLAPGPVSDRDEAGGHVERMLRLPAGLPLGEHRLLAIIDSGIEADVPLIVAPDQLPLPDSRLWGWMVQLYAVRTAWGMGDYADLAELASWSGAQGAGLLLVNPLHAVAPGTPIQNSPYFPASRRFSSPLYLRPELLPEYAAATDEVRTRVDALAAGVPMAEHIDRDTVWAAKSAALEALFAFAKPRPQAENSGGLDDFALWCALAERHGVDWRRWPESLQDPHDPAVAAARVELEPRAAFHRWLQHCCVEQLTSAQKAATTGGMSVGVVHDLAVGVDPGGSDAWALRGELATGFSIGAPPDSFNQQGQDWGLPPWRPDRLAETGYAPVRDMVRAVLRVGGGLRIDHILGLFRLWWVPEGSSAAAGTYVSYDADALLGVIALEAERAGALVVGEDLGTVPREVRQMLKERAVFGSTVLWFERDEDGALVPPEQWRDEAVASVTTHDLPTSAGFLTGEHVRVRARLGLLNDPAAEEANSAKERAEMQALLGEEGLAPGDGLQEQIVALHELLALSPSRVLLAALADAVGDLRQPNMPGTVDEYPNWRLPVADGAGRVLSRAELCASPGALRLAAALQAGKP
ncbi:MAG TPA: 4-alpha-glucanotransferase [Frankiaceae bacterium]|jgi:4-alpha-glucanotransferase|nr:4-alpha-glucanotransferase [Frankiaceae bacterium]